MPTDKGKWLPSTPVERPKVKDKQHLSQSIQTINSESHFLCVKKEKRNQKINPKSHVNTHILVHLTNGVMDAWVSTFSWSLKDKDCNVLLQSPVLNLKAKYFNNDSQSNWANYTCTMLNKAQPLQKHVLIYSLVSKEKVHYS